MKIVSLTLENFRSYRTPVTITFNDLTVLIGKNDIGKSKSPNKKYSVYVKNKEGVPKLISFGQKNSKDFISGTATKEEREVKAKC